jgi:hypothetical protein
MILPVLLAVIVSQAPNQEPVDVSAVKDKLLVLHDGQGHYVAVDPDAPYGGNAFVGNGKVFYKLRAMGGGKMGTESWSVSCWDPRVRHGSNSPASIEMKDSGKSYEISCGKKTTPVSPLPADEAKKLLADAKFFGFLWTRLPERLLRDDTGVYYLVDRLRTEEGNDRRDFRVYAGKRGEMKQLPLKDVVDDVKGLIFATKDGSLRLVTSTDGKPEGKWIKGKKSVELTEVPLDNFETARLVYMELGPYAGQRLGTPCDDIM